MKAKEKTEGPFTAELICSDAVNAERTFTFGEVTCMKACIVCMLTDTPTLSRQYKENKTVDCSYDPVSVRTPSYYRCSHFVPDITRITPEILDRIMVRPPIIEENIDAVGTSSITGESPGPDENKKPGKGGFGRKKTDEVPVVKEPEAGEVQEPEPVTKAQTTE